MSENIGQEIANELLILPLGKRIRVALKIIFKRGIL